MLLVVIFVVGVVVAVLALRRSIETLARRIKQAGPSGVTFGPEESPDRI